MFNLSELIVREDDLIQDLIEQRARSFYSIYQKSPTTAFVSAEIYRNLLREIYYSNNTFTKPQQTQNLVSQTSMGIINLIVTEKTKSFLLVGVDSSLADLEFYNGIPRELWSDYCKQKIDEEFEKIVLGGL
jgi:hypothetical protein